jgi:ATP-dependent Zn protease
MNANSLFRSAVFPLIVVVLLVYLGSQTLMNGRRDPTRVPYSQVVGTVRQNPGEISKVVLQRNRGVVVERVDGTTWKATNPNEASQLALERLLINQRVTYDWTQSGTWPWWSLIAIALPVFLIVGFWHLLNSRRDERVRVPDREAN